MKEIIDVGNTVICDMCSKDYTNSDEQGGVLFYSYAYCPSCVKRRNESFPDNGFGKGIREVCPEGMTYREWVLGLRGGNNKITLESF